MTLTRIHRDEQLGLRRGHGWLVPGGYGQYRALPADLARDIGDRYNSAMPNDRSYDKGSLARRDHCGCGQDYWGVWVCQLGIQTPKLYHGSSMERVVYLELFESLADWNDWMEKGKAKQLRMSFPGACTEGAQNIGTSDQRQLWASVRSYAECL